VIPVTDEPGRVLPADPWSIQLTYRHRQPWWFDANSEPERWRVSADVGDDSDTEIVSHVGDIDIVLVDLSATADPFSVLDGEDADLGLVAEALFDPATGQLATELDELIEPAGDRLLILGSVRLAPAWRGFGLGVLLAGVAIKKLSGGVRFAACYPAPLGEPGDAGGERTRTRPSAVWPW
jgi:GNAT superfamily N-acetyltransferase